MSDDLFSRPGPQPDQTLSYGASDLHVLDLYLGAAPTTVVLIHGGFWRSRYDRTHLRAMAAALRERGPTVVLPEYRRVGDPGGGWPGSLEDVLECLLQLPSLLPHTGPLVLVGHSAGGHLAMLAAGQEPSGAVSRVVSLAGVLDLAAAGRDRLSNGAVDEFLGERFTELASADPSLQPLPEAELTLIHGDCDEDVPLSQSVDFANREPRIGLQVLAGAGHLDLVDPSSPYFDQVAVAIC